MSTTSHPAKAPLPSTSQEPLASASASAVGASCPLTIFRDLSGKTLSVETHTLASLEQRICSTVAATKAGLPLLSGARFGNTRSPHSSLRRTENVLGVTAVVLDYDKGGPSQVVADVHDRLKLANVTHLIYTTSSHRPDAARFRVICPLIREHAPGEYVPFVEVVNYFIGGGAAIESKTLSQPWYFGRLQDATDFACHHHDGVPLDLCTRLQRRPLDGPTTKARSHATGAPGGTATIIPLGPRPAGLPPGSALALNAAAQANLPSPFNGLSAEAKNALLAEILRLPEIIAIADEPRPEWLKLLFSLADAGHRGATAAHDIALEWSRTSARFENEGDFDRDWGSFKPDHPGGITVATLLGLARDAGFDLGVWFAHHGTAGAEGRETYQETNATGALARAPDWKSIPQVMTEAAAGMILNQLLGFARKFGGEPAYFMRHHDGSVTPLIPSMLGALLAPYRVLCIRNGQKEYIPAAGWWKHWPHRYTVDSVEYDPEGVCTHTIENTWRGFAIQPVKGSWRRLRWHLLYVICGGKKIYFNYLVRWLAHAVQRPGTSPDTMVVLLSTAEGVGKSTVGNVIARMFGPHALIANSSSAVFGEFNETLADKSFILLEETAFPGDHKLAAALKNTVTAPTLSINPKGRTRYSIPNRLHFMLCTNEAWAVPAGADARRFFVLKVNFDPPPGYFERLYAEIDGGGVEAMLHDLQRVNLSNFHPRNVPATAELIHQQRLSADQVTRWVFDCIAAGQIVDLPYLTDEDRSGGGFGKSLRSTLLYRSLCDWARAQGIRHVVSHVEFGRALQSLGMTRIRSNSGREWKVPDAATLLAATERRARIRQVTRR